MHYLYLLILCFSVLFPFIFSFHPKIAYYKTWKYLFPSIIITSIIFILWDIYFTKIGIWGFNAEYVLGIYFYNLPLEEILFFICIPFSSIFIYHLIELKNKENFITLNQNQITNLLLLISATVSIFNFEKAYTASTFISLFIFLLILKYPRKTNFLGNFYFSFIFILIPFFIVNGILTGSFIEGEVVWYNESEFSGIRIFTIPIEDTFYGMLLLLLNISIYNFLKKKKIY